MFTTPGNASRPAADCRLLHAVHLPTGAAQVPVHCASLYTVPLPSAAVSRGAIERTVPAQDRDGHRLATVAAPSEVVQYIFLPPLLPGSGGVNLNIVPLFEAPPTHVVP